MLGAIDANAPRRVHDLLVVPVVSHLGAALVTGAGFQWSMTWLNEYQPPGPSGGMYEVKFVEPQVAEIGVSRGE